MSWKEIVLWKIKCWKTTYKCVLFHPCICSGENQLHLLLNPSQSWAYWKNKDQFWNCVGKEKKKKKTEGQVFNDKVSSRAKMLWRESCCLYSWTAQFRAFKAIKSHLWQSWGMISAQDCCNVKLEAMDLVFVFLVHLEEPEMSFMSCHSGPTDVPVGGDVLSLPARRLVSTGQDCGQQRPFIPKEPEGSLRTWRTLCDLFSHPAAPGTRRFLAF